MTIERWLKGTGYGGVMDLSNTTPRALVAAFVAWMAEQIEDEPLTQQFVDDFFTANRLDQQIVMQIEAAPEPEPDYDFIQWTFRQGRHNKQLVYAMAPGSDEDADGRLVMTCDDPWIAEMVVANHNEIKEQREASKRAAATAQAEMTQEPEMAEWERGLLDTASTVPFTWPDPSTRCGAMDPMAVGDLQCRYMAGHGGNHSDENDHPFVVEIASVRSNPALCYDTYPGEANIYCERPAGHDGWHHMWRPIEDGQPVSWPKVPSDDDLCGVPENQYGVTCMRPVGHDGEHRADLPQPTNGMVSWPTRCGSISTSSKVRCSLEYGHDGIHTHVGEDENGDEKKVMW